MSEETNNEVAVVENVQQMINIEDEDQALHTGLILPTYDDINDQSALKNVKDIFRGFSFDATENYESKFQDTEQLSAYIKASMEDIDSCTHKAEAGRVLHNAAAMARFWCMSFVMKKALDDGKYGTAACASIATRLAKSTPYIYSIKDVSKRLTMTDCYLLGLRGCSSTTLRSLAKIKDDDTRQSIIKAFINSYTDTADSITALKAKKALITAINLGDSTTFLEDSTSDPVAGGSVIIVSDAYQEVMSNMQKWQKMLKKPSREDLIEQFCNAAANFSITESVPEAEIHLAEVKQEAEKTKAILLSVKNNIEDAVRELESLEGASVLKDETTN